MKKLFKGLFAFSIMSLIIIFQNCNQPSSVIGEKGDTGAMGNAITAWHTVGAAGEPAFQNGWENYNDFYSTTSYQGLQYGLDGSGFLYITGYILDTTPVVSTTETVFTLPSGFRPKVTQTYIINGLNIYVGLIEYNLYIMPDGTFALGAIQTTTATNGQSFAFLGTLIVKLK